ncbi:MAG: hypothetical protein JWN38_689 [Candidatus Saccharibacteria bacterium]|nr:hypothetical protein [Candidatus Saccharibacteria bacterium]
MNPDSQNPQNLQVQGAGETYSQLTGQPIGAPQAINPAVQSLPQQPMAMPQPPAPIAPPAPVMLPPAPQAAIPTQPIVTPNYGQPQPVVYAPQGGGPATGAPIPPKTNPNSTQNTLQIAEIRDGIVIMNDGSYRSVVMVKSINFDLMSLQEQEAVEYSYQGFLNSLYFPVQIFVRSQKVDLQPYIEKLDKIRTEHDNMLLALLMEDYIDYIDDISQRTNIMDKKFYVVIPFFPGEDVKQTLAQSKNLLTSITGVFNKKEQHVVINEGELEAAKSELRNRVQAVLSGLLQCSIKGLPLDTQELIELYYDTYNPDTATRQQLKNFEDLTADVIMKGEGVAKQAHLQRELQ